MFNDIWVTLALLLIFQEKAYYCIRNKSETGK